ncbi:hypothetical protein [Clostridioides sp. ZZV15-6598]|uniref:hypothetical protein n=1 Tax=Clostridioides sp. ZZV15-6598 TaxID=2811501 RepID=UPI001D10D5D9|nr:hypothetical protein [Clostridioides sp. ZZV15-6598]
MSEQIQALVDILQYAGVILITISLAILIYKLIIYKNDYDKRTILMQGTTKLVLGALMLGLMLSLAGFLQDIIVNMGTTGGSEFKSSELNFVKDLEDEDSFLANGIAFLLDSVTKFIFSGDGFVQEKLLGTKTLEELIFAKDLSIFTKEQWSHLVFGYGIVQKVAYVLLILMVFFTAVRVIKGSVDERQDVDTKESLQRWVFVCLIIAGGPVLVNGIIVFSNFLTSILNESFSHVTMSNSILDELKTGNVLTTAIIKVYFAYLTLRVNIVFMVRTWVLGIMFVFTPIASALWGINKNINAFEIWFGEILSNSITGLCYSIVFVVFSLFFSATSSLLFILIGLTLTIKLSDVLRNSVQGYFAKLSGIDEYGEARRFTKGTLGAISGMVKAFKASTAGTAGTLEALEGLMGHGDKEGNFSKMAKMADRAINGGIGNKFNRGNDPAEEQNRYDADMKSSYGDNIGLDDNINSSDDNNAKPLDNIENELPIDNDPLEKNSDNSDDEYNFGMNKLDSSKDGNELKKNIETIPDKEPDIAFKNPSNAERAVQGMFFNNLSKKDSYGNKDDGVIFSAINDKRNMGQVESARIDTINSIAGNIMEKPGNNLDITQATGKAEQIFDTAMFNSNVTEPDKEHFYESVSKGDIDSASKFLASSTKDNSIDSLLKDSL